MASTKVTYKEPKGYFNKDMLKAADAWDKANAKKTNPKPAPKKGKK